MTKGAKVQFRAIEDIAGDLGISEADVIRLLRSHAAPAQRDHRGRISIPVTYIGTITANAEYPAAVTRLLDRQRQWRAKDDAGALINRRKRLIDRYQPLIADLEEVHRRYLNQANDAGVESAGMASYLLLSRAIALLKVLKHTLRDGHWYSGSLLRDIDETLDLAYYFAVTKETDTGRRALHRWFRENEAPSHATCREAMAKHRSSLEGGASGAEHLELLRELYRKKSKWVHPTLAAIREVTQYGENSLRVAGIDYGPCAYERKLYELTDFFKSSIWSAFQTLFLCFHYTLTLSEDDRRLLHSYDRMFGDWTERARADLDE